MIIFEVYTLHLIRCEILYLNNTPTDNNYWMIYEGTHTQYLSLFVLMEMLIVLQKRDNLYKILYCNYFVSVLINQNSISEHCYKN